MAPPPPAGQGGSQRDNYLKIVSHFPPFSTWYSPLAEPSYELEGKGAPETHSEEASAQSRVDRRERQTGYGADTLCFIGPPHVLLPLPEMLT